MASSYTDNKNRTHRSWRTIETWGTTTNNNLEIIDKALNGVTDVGVTGAMNITVTDGDKSSNGHTRVLKLTDGGGGASTLTIHPDDREAFYIVHNGSGSTVTFKQGSDLLIMVLKCLICKSFYLCRWKRIIMQMCLIFCQIYRLVVQRLLKQS